MLLSGLDQDLLVRDVSYEAAPIFSGTEGCVTQKVRREVSLQITEHAVMRFAKYFKWFLLMVKNVQWSVVSVRCY